MPLYDNHNMQFRLPNEMSKGDRDGRNEKEAFKPNILSKEFTVQEFEAVKETVSAHIAAKKYSAYFVSEGGQGKGMVLRIVMLNADEVNYFLRQMNKKLGDNAFKANQQVTWANQSIARERLGSGFEARSTGLRSYFGQTGAVPATKKVVDHSQHSRDGARVTRENVNTI